MIIQYADPKVATTYLKIGKEKLDRMTDEQLLECWNEDIEALDDRHAEPRVRSGGRGAGGQAPGPLLRQGRPEWVPRGRASCGASYH